MTRLFQNILFASLTVLAVSGVTLAQGPNKEEKIPVKVQIVISRYEGERKVSSLPYTLFAIANGDRVSFNVGANLPIVSSNQSTDGKSTPSVSYTNVGTSITSSVTTEGGRYRMTLDVRDQTVIAPKPTTTPDASPKLSDYQSWGNFQFNGTLNVKEGETKQVISAADKIEGVVVKLDVTLTLDK
jgi:hypothetical protein